MSSSSLVRLLRLLGGWPHQQPCGRAFILLLLRVGLLTVQQLAQRILQPLGKQLSLLLLAPLPLFLRLPLLLLSSQLLLLLLLLLSDQPHLPLSLSQQLLL